jgi:hypothetical protein
MKKLIAAVMVLVMFTTSIGLFDSGAAGGERLPAARPIDPRVAIILEAAKRAPKENLIRVFVIGQNTPAATAPAREISGEGDWLILRLAKGAPETYVNVANVTYTVFLLPGERSTARSGSIGGRDIRSFIPQGVDIDDLDFDDFDDDD